jgi:heme A synthase
MSGTLGAIHTNVGYLVFLILVVATVAAFRQSDARPPVSRASSLTMVLLDVHVTLGIIYYVTGGWWSATVLKSIAHPVLALLALAFGHIGLSKARKEGGSKRDAAYGLLRALILVTLAIGVVSA